MNEWVMILVMSASGALFAAGGTHIDGIGGQKWIRRFLLPAILASIALLSHVVWWKAVGMAVSLIVALSMGYGSRTPYWLKMVTFVTYGASFLWLGFSYWVILTPILCFSLFCLSNWKPMATTFFWKACEFLYGTLIGITFISTIRS